MPEDSRFVSKIILTLCFVASASATTALIILRMPAEYVMSFFTLTSSFGAAIMTYVNTGTSQVKGVADATVSQVTSAGSGGASPSVLGLSK